MLACSAGFIFGQIAMPGRRSVVPSGNMLSNILSGDLSDVSGAMSGAATGTTEACARGRVGSLDGLNTTPNWLVVVSL